MSECYACRRPFPEPKPLLVGPVKVDGLRDEKLDITYWGVATPVGDGKFQCIAATPFGVARVEISIEVPEPARWEGDDN